VPHPPRQVQAPLQCKHIHPISLIITNIQQVYHVDKYHGYKEPGWEDWYVMANDVTVKLGKWIEETRAADSKKKTKGQSACWLCILSVPTYYFGVCQKNQQITWTAQQFMHFPMGTESESESEIWTNIDVEVGRFLHHPQTWACKELYTLPRVIH
jgi:hypothetical protein